MERRETGRAEITSWRHSGLIAATVVVLLVWGLSWAGAFAGVDGLAYDVYARAAARHDPGPARVLLVELDPSASPPETTLTALIEKLDTAGATAIGFTSVPPGVGPAFFERAVRARVIFGRAVVRDRRDPSAASLAPVPAAATAAGVTWGAVDAAPSEAGIHRGHRPRVVVEGQSHPTFEAAVARAAGAAIPAAPYFRIRFRGGTGSLPAIDPVRLLAGGPVDSLVRGNAVLVGSLPAPAAPGLDAPTTSGGAGFSPLDYQGQVVQALVGGRLIGAPLSWQLVLMMLGVGVFSLVAYQWLDVNAAWRFTGFAIVVVLAGAGVAFIRVGTWWPISELVAAQVGVLLVMLRRRAHVADEAAARMLVQATGALQGRSWPASFYVSQEHWEHVVTMVNQSLDLARLIFLERYGPEPRLRAIKAWNCTVDDISEMRRDYRRTPYLTAMQAMGPIRLERYLANCGPGEIQYLVPLVFAGDVVGFWALSVHESRIGKPETFESIVGLYAHQIAELVYLRQRVMGGEERGHSLVRYLTSERSAEAYQLLRKSFELVEHRMLRLQSLLASAATPTVVYDLFGRVLEVNDGALELLRAAGLTPFEMTAVDVLARLTSTDLGNARRMLRYATFESTSLAAPAVLESRPQSTFLVNIRALRRSRELVPRGDAAPFGVLGFVLEIVDTTAITGIRKLIADLATKLGAQLRADLAAIELAAPMVGEVTDVKQREQLVETIMRKAEACAGVTEESLAYLTTQAAEFDDHECFPIDPRVAFARAREQVKPQLEAHEIALEAAEPALISQVLASPASLDGCFQAVLTYMVKDCPYRGRVTAKADQGEHDVTYTLRNNGFGIPGEKLNEYLAAERILDSHELENLRKAAALVRAWGGTMRASTAVGEGTEVQLVLRKFI